MLLTLLDSRQWETMGNMYWGYTIQYCVPHNFHADKVTTIIPLLPPFQNAATLLKTPDSASIKNKESAHDTRNLQ